MSNAEQIVHESETQRQYIRLQLPASVKLGDARHSIKDLSSGGLAIRDIEKGHKKDQKIDLTLILPFADFTIDIQLSAEIQYIDKKLKIAGCRFTDLTQSQTSILNHVMRSFIAGDLENGAEIINVVARDNFANIRKHKNDNTVSRPELIKRYSLYGLTLLTLIIVSSFILSNLAEKMFVIKTTEASVFLKTINLSAPTAGTYVSALPEGVKTVEKNTPLAKIVNIQNNDTVVIYSPCDCYITQTKILDGQYTPQDQTLFSLIGNDEVAVVKALVPLENAQHLTEDTEASIEIIGLEAPIKGNVLSVHLSKENNPLTLSKAEVIIQPSNAVPIDYINRLASVEFYL